jgi:hypothetical protein
MGGHKHWRAGQCRAPAWRMSTRNPQLWMFASSTGIKPMPTQNGGDARVLAQLLSSLSVAALGGMAPR